MTVCVVVETCGDLESYSNIIIADSDTNKESENTDPPPFNTELQNYLMDSSYFGATLINMSQMLKDYFR